MLVMALVVKSNASFSSIGNHYYNLWFPTKINTWASIVVNSFMTEAVTIQTCSANQWTNFYMITVSVMKELIYVIDMP